MSILAVGLAITTCFASFAYDTRSTEKTVELTTSAAFNYNSLSSSGQSLGSTTEMRASLGIGYFFTPMLEMLTAVRLGHTTISPSGTSSVTDTELGLGGTLLVNFGTSGNPSPFVGVGVAFQVHAGDLSGNNPTLVAPSLQAGMRFPIGNSASFNMIVSFEHQMDALGIQDVTSNVILFGVGISAFVRGGPTD